ADSSADILEMENVEFAQVPLKIITADKEYVDNDDLDVEDMLSDLEAKLTAKGIKFLAGKINDECVER
ncbi:MAG: DegV family protein, partial [Ruminiclostridium sp.]|nr:DegV family protein [Ruminiclostridium sp.]